MRRRAWLVAWLVATLAVWNYVFDYYVADGVTTYLAISAGDPSGRARTQMDAIMRTAARRGFVRATAAALLVVLCPLVIRAARPTRATSRPSASPDAG